MTNDTFTCSGCGETFEKGWSEEEARNEFAEVFPNMKIEEACLVCDDCYTAMGLQ